MKHDTMKWQLQVAQVVKLNNQVLRIENKDV